MKRDVTITIPTIPPREPFLRRAITSAQQQTERVAGYSVAVDIHREGAWTTRNRAAAGVTTEWLAFLDDDDELLPIHCQFLLDRAEETGADVVWGWFEVRGGIDPFPGHRGRQYDPAHPHIFPITALVRTELMQACIRDAGGFQPDPDGEGNWMIQDRPVWDYCAKEGRGMLACMDTTWIWNHHMQGHTSGVPSW